MACKAVFAIFVILNIQGFQTKTLPQAPINACTTEEAISLSVNHINDMLISINNAAVTSDQEIDEAGNKLTQLIAQSTETQQKVVDDLQSDLNEALKASMENGMSSGICLGGLQFHLDGLSQKTQITLQKCALHAQEKQFSLTSKQSSVQDKSNSIAIKASIALEKYALGKYAVLTCEDLDAQLQLRSDSYLKKANELTNKISKSVNEVTDDYNKCVHKLTLSTFPYVAFIKQRIAICMPPQQPSTTEDHESGQSTEATEAASVEPEHSTDEPSVGQSGESATAEKESSESTEEIDTSNESGSNTEENLSGEQKTTEGTEENVATNEPEVSQSNETDNTVESNGESVPETGLPSGESESVTEQNQQTDLPSEGPVSASAEQTQSNEAPEGSGGASAEVEQELDQTSQQDQRNDEEASAPQTPNESSQDEGI